MQKGPAGPAMGACGAVGGVVAARASPAAASSRWTAIRSPRASTWPTLPEPDVWSLANPIVYALVWIGIILAIFVPLSIRQYNKAATR